MTDTPHKPKPKRAKLSRKCKSMAAKAKPVPTVKRVDKSKPVSAPPVNVACLIENKALEEKYGRIAIPKATRAYVIFRQLLEFSRAKKSKAAKKYGRLIYRRLHRSLHSKDIKSIPRAMNFFEDIAAAVDAISGASALKTKQPPTVRVEGKEYKDLDARTQALIAQFGSIGLPYEHVKSLGQQSNVFQYVHHDWTNQPCAWSPAHRSELYNVLCDALTDSKEGGKPFRQIVYALRVLQDHGAATRSMDSLKYKMILFTHPSVLPRKKIRRALNKRTIPAAEVFRIIEKGSYTLRQIYQSASDLGITIHKRRKGHPSEIERERIIEALQTWRSILEDELAEITERLTFKFLNG